MDPYYNTPPLPTEAYEPWESPPPIDRFATPEEALTELNKWAATLGFSGGYRGARQSNQARNM